MEQKTKGLSRRTYDRIGGPTDFNGAARRVEVLKMVANGKPCPPFP